MLVRRARCLSNLERLVRGLRLLLLCGIGLSSVKIAFAHTVAIVQPPRPSTQMAEALARLHGELLSVGYEVMRIERPLRSAASTRSSESLNQVLAEHDEVEAALVLIGQEAPIAVEVWMVTGAQDLQRIARVDLELNADNASKRLAIRTIEVLRAGLLESRLARPERTPPAATPAEIRKPAEPAEVPAPVRRFGIELGIAALASSGGVGPAFLPVLRADWAMSPRWVLHASFAGFGPRTTLESAVGSARVGMHYGLVGLSVRGPSDTWLKGFAALSAGVFVTNVDGHAQPPLRGHAISQPSFLLDAGLGVAFALTPRYFASWAIHAQLAEPYAAVHIADQKVATLGRPNLLTVLTLGGWP